MVAAEAIAAHQGFVPGLGHHLHKDGDPRTPVLIGIARAEGQYGPHLALFEAVGRMAPKKLPLNGAGACGAALADLGIATELCRGVVLLARTAGILGHLAEEIHTVARSIFDESSQRRVQALEGTKVTSALIIGGSGGLGRAMAETFAERGESVIVTSPRKFRVRWPVSAKSTTSSSRRFTRRSTAWRSSASLMPSTRRR